MESILKDRGTGRSDIRLSYNVLKRMDGEERDRGEMIRWLIGGKPDPYSPMVNRAWLPEQVLAARGWLAYTDDILEETDDDDWAYGIAAEFVTEESDPGIAPAYNVGGTRAVILTDLWVDPEWRRQGIAKHFLSHLHDLAYELDSDYTGIYTCVYPIEWEDSPDLFGDPDWYQAYDSDADNLARAREIEKLLISFGFREKKPMRTEYPVLWMPNPIFEEEDDDDEADEDD